MRAVNLLPPEERTGGGSAAVGRRALGPWHAIVAVAAVALVALLGAWAAARHDAASAREATARALARNAEAQAQVVRLAPVLELDARRRARETAVLALANGRTDWAGVLRAVAGALPRQVALTTLGLRAAGAADAGTTGSTPAGLQGTGTVTIAACADTQPRVATALRALRALPQVEDVALNQTSRTTGSSGGSGGGSAGGSGVSCPDVSVDAAVGLSAASLLDAVRPTASAAGGGTGAGANGAASGAAEGPDRAAADPGEGTSR